MIRAAAAFHPIRKPRIGHCHRLPLQKRMHHRSLHLLQLCTAAANKTHKQRELKGNDLCFHHASLRILFSAVETDSQ
jgi:hypothetical protein